MKIISPRRLLLFSFLIWVIFNILIPVTYIFKASLLSFVILMSYILFFYLGTYQFDLFKFISKRNNMYLHSSPQFGMYYDKNKINKMHLILLFLSAIGSLLKFYDLFIIKKYLSYGNPTAFRFGYMPNEFNNNFFIATISSALFPIGIFLPLFNINFRKYLKKYRRIIAYVVSLMPILYFILRGGRTIISLTFVMILTSIILKDKKELTNYLKNRKLIFTIIVISILFFVYSCIILNKRIYYAGYTNVTDYLYHMEDANYLIIDDSIIKASKKNNVLGIIIYTFISIMHYFVHGVYEFFALVKHYDINFLTKGAFQFYPFIKTLKIIGVDTISFNEIQSYIYRPQIYTTFFGPVFVDFGYFGFIYTFILGFICQFSWNKSLKGDLFHKIMYPYISAVIFHAPYLNMIQSGIGVYIIVSLIIIRFIIKSIKPIKNI